MNIFSFFKSLHLYSNNYNRISTGGRLIGQKNGSIILANRTMRIVNKIAVLRGNKEFTK